MVSTSQAGQIIRLRSWHIKPTSLDDLQAEVANYEAMLEQSLQELVSHARMNGDSA